MGIFETIVGGITGIAQSPVGQVLAQKYLGGGNGGGYGGPPIIQLPGTFPAPPPVMTGGYTPVSTMPASFPVLPGGNGQTFQPAFGLQVPQPVPGGFDPDVISFFKPTKTGATPYRFLEAKNPVTGKTTVWENAGSPLAFSRDCQAKRRLERLGKHARRRTCKRRKR